MASASTSSSSSSSSLKRLRITEPDATYTSLSALLISPAPSAADHLALIPAPSISSSITHYLSTLPNDEIPKFARNLSTSTAFWRIEDDSGRENGNEESKRPKVSLLSRCSLVFEATARAVLARIQVIVNENRGSVGWNSRRLLVSWLRSLADAVQLDPASLPSSCNGVALSSLAIHTGLVAGLQAAKDQRKREGDIGMRVGYALRRAEDEWCVSLADCLDPLARRITGAPEVVGQEAGDWQDEFRKIKPQKEEKREVLDEARTATLHLAAQVAPAVPAKKLETLPAESLLCVYSEAILGLFEQSQILDNLREDIKQDTEGSIYLDATSSTLVNTRRTAIHPLFPLLGPLSRMLSLALSALVRTLPPADIHALLFEKSSSIQPSDTSRQLVTRMKMLAKKWQSKWLSTRLSGAKEEDIASSSRPLTAAMWNVFKSLLFSFTMIFDALMEAVVDVAPSPTMTLPLPSISEEDNKTKRVAVSTSNIPLSYLEITSTILITYSHLSWITATFGSTTFDTYRRVFYEALDVIGRDGEACLALLDFISPLITSTPIEVGVEANEGRRAGVVYYLDVTEQIIPSLSDYIVEREILPICRPYLDSPQFQDAFESSHSVVLSVFSNQKPCSFDLAPFYLQNVLQHFPLHLQETQFLHAISTIISNASDKDDALAWFCIDKLWDEMEKVRLRPFVPLNDENQGKEEKGKIGKEHQEGLQHGFISQLPNVNLVLLRSILTRIRLVITREPEGSASRTDLCERTFDNLGSLDASTREEGLRWWLEHRREFGV